MDQLPFLCSRYRNSWIKEKKLKYEGNLKVLEQYKDTLTKRIEIHLDNKILLAGAKATSKKINLKRMQTIHCNSQLTWKI